MIRALYTSATGMKAQELLIDNTANNLANVNNNGFKRSQVDFADLIYVTVRQAGTEILQGQETPVGLQVGSGVRPSGITKVFTQGTVEQTGNPFDLAIEGEGFFKVTNPTGVDRYTRDGAFRPDSQGKLVNQDGWELADVNAIPVGTSRIAIAADGTVTGIAAGETDSTTQLGTINLYQFVNPAGLSSEGGDLYAPTAASGTETQTIPGQVGAGILRQGFLEGSNVEVVTELISLISAQRAYEINSRAIRAGDEMLSTSSEIVR